MKKIIRDLEKYDVFDLFSAMAAKHGYKLDSPLSQDDFVERIKTSLEKNLNNDITIFGKRVETIFAYVIGALGYTALLKQEDTGSLYSIDNEIILPDYKLVLKNGNQLLIEVKNFHNLDPMASFSIKQDYFLKLKKYSDLCKVNLMFAIYFSLWNQWVLLPIEAFDNNNSLYSINFATAMAKSEMSIIGDKAIGTLPDLELHILSDEEEAYKIQNDGQPFLTVKKILIYCAGIEVINPIEKEIAFYLIRFGDWIEKEIEEIFINDRFLGMKFIYTPQNRTEENFAIIGRLSSMVTNMFKEQTIEDGKITAVDSSLDPEQFKVFIPDNYKGQQLPLWQFSFQSNPSFKR